MWPLYVLFNKAFRAEEDRVSETERLGFFEYFLREQPSGNGTSCGSALCRSRFIEVPHINQLYYWDCGLACVLMVFRTVGINSHNIKSIAELCCTTSIWTVDLAYILQKFSVSFSYYTVTFGVNPNYSVETFYKEQLPNDLLRVDTLFKKSLEAGINIQCRSISREEISRLILSGKYIAIALVDQHKFRSNSLKESWLKDVFMTDFTGSNSNYTGHYVIICGYDSLTDEFEIRDPASARKHVKVSSDCLEEARKSFGTDEDLLLISLEKSDEQLSPDR
ncbi:protein GUCD1 isoform X1 [Morus notabilis]|uniref:protein GUCD1 isoform X1 n=1 Tax=Morus notabilis TaxID=981085 RepID=UPI000CED1157|nr:protein GUCD1 isoform X1 [Morus notabilis]XP_024027790.1 protein GUCD1 isoform X1 [Morus notabilis]